MNERCSIGQSRTSRSGPGRAVDRAGL